MGDKNFRLPHHVRPERYILRIAPDPESRTLRGSGDIHLELDTPVRELKLHGSFLEVSNAKVLVDGKSLDASVTANEVSQTLTFALPSEVPAGKAVLRCEWTGKIHEDLRGMYLAGDVVVTQLEAADARRVFPCFDEPSFKAEWHLSMEVPAGLTPLSNGKVVSEEPLDDGRRLVTFAPTPRMSSYLVALVAGNLVSSDPLIVRNVELRTWSVPEKKHLTRFAQECASAVLPLLEDYFDLPYAFGKLDQVGIPDFEAGAMENSGCVTFREVVLLLDREKAPLNVRKRIAEVITHELAHMWFGNLVTMKWWDDLWLNEAFATWLAYKIVDQWQPGWRMWDDFENGKAAALYLDSLESTHPIHTEVLNADQATENFDLITYEKGGAMLRMLEGYLGEEAFRAGIREYMKKHSWKNAEADDLWDALEQASGQPIREVANGWIHRGGYPLVTLRRQGARVKLSQRRYFSDPRLAKERSRETWLVPVVLRWADDEGEHETRHLLRERSETVTLPAKGEVRFVCGNKGGAGFYRVAYGSDDIAALALHRNDLAPVERANVLADAWALFRAGSVSLSLILDIITALGSDPDYVVLGEIVSRLEFIEKRIADGETRPVFRRMVSRLLGAQLEEVGWDPKPGESDEERLRRAAVVRALALVSRRFEAVSEASQRFGRHLWGDDTALAPDLLDTAALAAAREGDEELFETLLGRLDDPDPAAKRRTLVALASFESDDLRKRAIDLFFTDSVPMQDSSTYIQALLSNPAARTEAWAVIRERWSEVHRKTAAPMLMRRVVESFGELVRERDEVEEFLKKNEETFATVPSAVRQTRERLRLDEELRTRGRPELDAWLARGREL